MSRLPAQVLEHTASGAATLNRAPGTPAFAPRFAMVRGIARFAGLLSALLGMAALAACATAPPDYGAYESNLAAAGFAMKPANTPQRQAMLARLPQHRFVMRQNGDAIHYVYADSVVCDCLYVGNQQAFNQYKANQMQQQYIDQRQLIALTYSDAAWSWDAWGPWGGAAGFDYGPVGW